MAIISVKGHPPHRAVALLRSRIDFMNGTDAEASAVVALCGEIDGALAPIIGPHGVSALYKRSLYLASQAHPCLNGLHDSADTLMDVSALRARLDGLPAGQAALVGGALLETFHDLLESLVGSSLTERLLRSLWDRPLSDPPALEPTP